MALIRQPLVQLHQFSKGILERQQHPIDETAQFCTTQPEQPLKSTTQTSLLPRGAIDTHVHIFDPSLGPYSPSRAYTPPAALLTDLCSFSANVSARPQPANFVFVQPSTYGADNRVLMATLTKMLQDGYFARAIAVVDVDRITSEELYQMHVLGVRGLRLNMQSHGEEVNIPQLKLRIQAVAARIQHLPGWKIQIFAPAHVWNDLYSTIVSLPVPVIADHVGGLLGPSKLSNDMSHTPTLQAGFASLVKLAKMSRVFIKISGLYRSSTAEATIYDDMAPIIQELAKDVPDSLIWGSDWPHTGEGKDRLKSRDPNTVEPFRKIDNISILKHVRDWVGDEETWLKMMVFNPRRVFA